MLQVYDRGIRGIVAQGSHVDAGLVRNCRERNFCLKDVRSSLGHRRKNRTMMLHVSAQMSYFEVDLESFLSTVRTRLDGLGYTQLERMKVLNTMMRRH